MKVNLKKNYKTDYNNLKNIKINYFFYSLPPCLNCSALNFNVDTY